jgi:hypothetical protein
MPQSPLSRRRFVQSVPLFAAGSAALAASPRVIAAMRGHAAPAAQDAAGWTASVHGEFPAQNPALAREMVGVSHGNVARVKELLAMHPALAKASWDWGFGDHETALGAASHVGNREIASMLIDHGAPPTLFSATMLGQLDIVRALCEAHPGVQRNPGPHGITLLAHAKFGGEAAKPVHDYLLALGDADLGPANLPLTDDERNRYVGTYSFGEGETDALIVEHDRATLWLKRGPAGTRRGLSHAGDHTFTPAGAAKVMIRFTLDDGAANAAAVTVIDGPWMLEARR